MSSVGYRHDNSALTEQRVAQILSEARAAMKAVDAPRTKVCSSGLTLVFEIRIAAVVGICCGHWLSL